MDVVKDFYFLLEVFLAFRFNKKSFFLFYEMKFLRGNVRMYIKFQNEVLAFHKKFFLHLAFHLGFWFNSFSKLENMGEVKYIVQNKLINSRIEYAFLNMLD